MAEAGGVRRRTQLRRHRLLVGAVGIVAAAVAAGAVLAWHFSSAVLVVDHSGWSENIQVDRVRPGRVVLAAGEDSERPGVYGLDWPAGHAIVGAILEKRGDTVTRRLRSVQGYLASGMKATLDPRVFAGTPREALGLPFAEVEVPSEIGQLPAWLIPGRSGTWAIVVHGINGDLREGLRIAPPLARAHLPVLLISYRGDLGAPSAGDGLHHMGLTEWRDLQAAARYALGHGARRLVLIGYSMGGAVVTQFMERSSLRRRVAALILDAPVLDWRSVLEFNAREMGLPGFLAMPVEWAIDARINPDWDSLDALAHPQDLHLPILLFHGSEDSVVPIATSESLADEVPRWVTLEKVRGADHTESWNVDPARYDRAVSRFVARIGARRSQATRGSDPSQPRRMQAP